MLISCDTQIDCLQGDINKALFLISNLLLRVIRVCVCVFFYFFPPFQGVNLSLPPPLLSSAENLLAAPGKGRAWPAAFPCLAQRRAAGARGVWPSHHSDAGWEYFRARRGAEV